jgi:hypothetical protein
MSQIGVLGAGAGVATNINQSFVPSIILLPDGVTPPNLQSLTSTIDGVTMLSLTGSSIIAAYAQYMSRVNASASAILNGIIIATGFIAKQTLQLNLVNNAAGAVNIFGYSFRKAGKPVTGGMVVANPNAFVEIENFTALFFEPANLTTAQLYFADGHNERMTNAELRSLFGLSNDNMAGGLSAAGTVTVIDNQLGNIDRVTLYAGAGALTIAKVNVPV